MEPISSVIYELQVPDFQKQLPQQECGGLLGDYELISLEKQVPDNENCLGKIVKDFSTDLGSYGMGGYGFFGLRLAQSLNDIWIVVPIMHSGGMIKIDGHHIGKLDLYEDGAEIDYEQWQNDIEEQRNLVKGSAIKMIKIEKSSFRTVLDNGSVICLPDLAESSGCDQDFGFGFLPDDDLRKAITLSPTDQIFA